MMTRIGFTASRNGLTGEQIVSLGQVFSELPPYSELHHGDCIGGDATAHQMVKIMGWRVVVHPAHVAMSLRANMVGDELRERRGPLDRNIDIVEETSVLVACPGGHQEEIRSGTWQTIRAARKRQRRHIIVWPDGSCERSPDWGAGGADALLADPVPAVHS